MKSPTARPQPFLGGLIFETREIRAIRDQWDGMGAFEGSGLITLIT
jgi:hypothetical protein